ncbi:putative MFS allantoate transporter [Aspergillus fumigatus Af293]|uniref:MFS allantoate transporter, putative n=1 Tax=Aspergillus fumigatus (strain ATCC MYA-4609 / CBS 101355 / FGSC A1100 / Af293) TaxID=330879 RepID=Q4WD71_ASPFU|nr:MFS allantoate transporter, putative [Aspergillus fumigatus Af293]EAL85667.1 MFS allantoate transporter, putative [Aspergillus fumigatus Af293]
MGNMSSEKTLQNNKHADDLGEGAMQQIQECSAFSSTAEKRLVRKIDIMILPIMTFACMMAFLDKQALSYTAIMGLRTDLNLKGSEYSWSGSIFYFGYLFFSYPASILMVKFPLGKYLACNLFVILPKRLGLILTMNSMLWAIVLACHAATTNFAGLMVARFFLGCTEASVSSGFSLITSLWYRTSEQPLRHGIWFCGNSISMIIGNLVAMGIWQIKTGLQPWKWLFIIFGIVTFLWGILMFFRLPDTPNTASFLTEAEKLLATERLKANNAGYKRNKIDTSQIIEAFIDPKTWLLAPHSLRLRLLNLQDLAAGYARWRCNPRLRLTLLHHILQNPQLPLHRHRRSRLYQHPRQRPCLRHRVHRRAVRRPPSHGGVLGQHAPEPGNGCFEYRRVQQAGDCQRDLFRHVLHGEYCWAAVVL